MNGPGWDRNWEYMRREEEGTTLPASSYYLSGRNRLLGDNVTLLLRDREEEEEGIEEEEEREDDGRKEEDQLGSLRPWEWHALNDEMEIRQGRRRRRQRRQQRGLSHHLRTSCPVFCSWYGVVCRPPASSCTILGLHLRSNDLEGYLDDTYITEITTLISVDLGDNYIMGPLQTSRSSSSSSSSGRRLSHHRSRWDHDLGNWDRLTYLDLSNNYLWGSIPNDIGRRLVSLQQLMLNDNYLGNRFIDSDCEGGYYPIPSSLGNMRGRLTGLDLSGNDFGGAVPANLGNSRFGTNLIYVRMHRNPYLGGSIRYDDNLCRRRDAGTLRELTVDEMNVHCDCCTEIRDDTESPTSYLTPRPTRRGGPYPPTHTPRPTRRIPGPPNSSPTSGPTHQGLYCHQEVQREALYDLYVSSGGLGEGPDNGDPESSFWIRNAGWDSPFLHHCSWYGVSCDPASLCVTGLNIGENNLTVTTDEGLGGTRLDEINTLMSLDLNNNQLTGTFPSQWKFDEWEYLTYLDLGGNFLSGTIPPEITGLTSLRQLHLYDNYLGEENGVTGGTIPPQLGYLSYLNLGILDLSFNEFGGLVPTELGLLEHLGSLRLNGNQFLLGIIDADHPICHLRIGAGRSRSGRSSSSSSTGILTDFVAEPSGSLECRCCTS